MAMVWLSFYFALMLHFSFVQTKGNGDKERRQGKAIEKNYGEMEGKESICKCSCQVARRQFY